MIVIVNPYKRLAIVFPKAIVNKEIGMASLKIISINTLTLTLEDAFVASTGLSSLDMERMEHDSNTYRRTTKDAIFCFVLYKVVSYLRVFWLYSQQIIL